MGLGLWNYRSPEFGLEVALLAAGVMFYLIRNAISQSSKIGVIGFGIFLIVVQVGDTFVPRAPLSDHKTAVGVLVFYTLFAGIAFLLERHKRTRVP